MLVEEEALPHLKPMKGKPLLGAIAAQTMVADQGVQELVLRGAATNRVELWLPKGIVDNRMHTLHKHKPFRAAPTAKLMSMRMPKRKFVAPGSSIMRVPLPKGILL